jgi:hypothetical protein
VFVAQPAAAADGDTLKMGQSVTANSRPTRANYIGADDTGVAFLFQGGSEEGGDQSVYSAALAGWARGSTNLVNGVYGYTSRPGGSGLIGSSEGSDGTGAKLRGPRAALALLGTGITAPPAGTAAHSSGEIQFDQDGNFWACVVPGSPGTWQKLAGPSAAGAFHPIDPARVYDSRGAAFTPGGGQRMTRNTDRTISVKDARNSAGAVTTADIVPAGATAIAYNITVAGPTGPNFLSVTPGGATSYTASTINFAGGPDIANAAIVKIDSSRQVKVFCGDQTGSTHVIIDITGYFR